MTDFIVIKTFSYNNKISFLIIIKSLSYNNKKTNFYSKFFTCQNKLDSLQNHLFLSQFWNLSN